MSMHPVVITAIFIIFFYPAAYLEAVILRYCHITGVEQAVDVGAKEYSIRNLMGAALAKRLYMARFKGWKSSFPGNCASSLVGICDQNAEGSLP